MNAIPPRRKPIIYSTAQSRRVAVTSEDRVNTPGSVVHAKEFGTMLTVCGEQTTSWFKFLDVPFHTVTQNRCRTCARSLTMQADAAAHIAS